MVFTPLQETILPPPRCSSSYMEVRGSISTPLVWLFAGDRRALAELDGGLKSNCCGFVEDGLFQAGRGL